MQTCVKEFAGFGFEGIEDLLKWFMIIVLDCLYKAVAAR